MALDLYYSERRNTVVRMQSTAAQLVQGGETNVKNGKYDLNFLVTTVCKLFQVIEDIKTNQEDLIKIVHENISPLLNYIECINEFDLKNPSLPYAELFGLFIELFTEYKVEVSSLQEDDIVYLQIDEVDNKFYFSFFPDYLEYAFGDFNKFETVPLSVLVPSKNLPNQPQESFEKKLSAQKVNIVAAYNLYHTTFLCS